MRQDDTEVGQFYRDDTVLAERLHAVDGVQRNPADYEEQDNDGQVLRGLHFSFLSRTQHPQHCASSGRRGIAAP